MSKFPVEKSDKITCMNSKYYYPYAKVEWDKWNLPDFEFADCVCCFYITTLDENKNRLRKYVYVQYFEKITQDSVKDLQIANYKPNGFLVINVEDKDVNTVISDLQNSPYYVD